LLLVGDNASVDYNLKTITELVAKPGLPDFHLTVVAVSMSERDKANFVEMCGCRHATFLDVKALSQLKSTLENVGRAVVGRLVITTTTTTTTTYAATNMKMGCDSGAVAGECVKE